MPQDKRLQLVLPEKLYDFVQQRKRSEKAIRDFSDLLNDWWPYGDRNSLLKTLYSSRYSQLLDELREFQLISSKRFLHGIGEIGPTSVSLSHIITQLGQRLGQTLFQVMGIADKLGAMIATFGTRLLSLLQKVRVFLVKLPSQAKDEFKIHAKVRRYGLLFVSYVITPMSIQLLTPNLLPFLAPELSFLPALMSFLLMAGIQKFIGDRLDKGVAMAFDGNAR